MRRSDIAWVGFFFLSYVALIPGFMVPLVQATIGGREQRRTLTQALWNVYAMQEYVAFSTQLLGMVVAPLLRLPLLVRIALRRKRPHPAMVSLIQLSTKWGLVATFAATVAVAVSNLSQDFDIHFWWGALFLTLHGLFAIVAAQLIPSRQTEEMEAVMSLETQ